MKKILFLDIDGVLNSAAYYAAHPEIDKWEYLDKHDIDPDAIAQLNRIVDATGCEIVISSGWRYTWTLNKLYDIFKFKSYTGKGLLSSTDNLGKLRSDEIFRWINEHGEPDWRYCVVDDEPIDLDLDRVKDIFVRTMYATGLDQVAADRVITMLNDDGITKEEQEGIFLAVQAAKIADDFVPLDIAAIFVPLDIGAIFGKDIYDKSVAEAKERQRR